MYKNNLIKVVKLYKFLYNILMRKGVVSSLKNLYAKAYTPTFVGGGTNGASNSIIIRKLNSYKKVKLINSV